MISNSSAIMPRFFTDLVSRGKGALKGSDATVDLSAMYRLPENAPGSSAPVEDITREGIQKLKEKFQRLTPKQALAHPDVGRRFKFEFYTNEKCKFKVDILVIPAGPIFVHQTLVGVDILFKLDDSLSMLDPAEIPWEEIYHYTSSEIQAMKTKLDALWEVIQDLFPTALYHDSNGLEAGFLNYKSNEPESESRPAGIISGIRQPDDIMRLKKTIAKNLKSTPLCRDMHVLLTKYIAYCRQESNAGRGFPTPLNILTITDGTPDDPALLRQALITCADALEDMDAPPTQVAIEIIQIGKDKAPSDYLEELDNLFLNGITKRDIVDARNHTQMMADGVLCMEEIYTLILGALLRRLDKSNNQPRGGRQ